MSTSKRPLPKMMKVAPTVTDPSMQNNSQDPELTQLQREMDIDSDETEELKKAVFDNKIKTQEETKAGQVAESQRTNMILIVIVVLVVVALIGIIFWLMNQPSNKKEEDEMRNRIRPHQRNNLPPLNSAANRPNQEQANQSNNQPRQTETTAQAPSQIQSSSVGQSAPQTQTAPGTPPQTNATPPQSTTLDNKNMPPIKPVVVPATKQELDKFDEATTALMDSDTELNDDDLSILDKTSKEKYENVVDD